jgi:hypothetical protein
VISCSSLYIAKLIALSLVSQAQTDMQARCHRTHWRPDPCRMWKEGVLPTTKTFVSLISALSKGADDAMDVVVEVCQHQHQFCCKLAVQIWSVR